jgi:hypothetical protein
MSDAQNPASTTEAILAFLREVGLEPREGSVPEHGAVPGVRIEAGGLVVDRQRLRHPGDLLHEAGHLAVMPPERRPLVRGRLEPDPAEEMMAIAWSYAAALHLGLDLAVLFHDEGYRGAGASLRENFAAGRFLGVPMLQWVGMSYEPRQALAHGVAPYPHMVRWLRDRPG